MQLCQVVVSEMYEILLLSGTAEEHSHLIKQLEAAGARVIVRRALSTAVKWVRGSSGLGLSLIVGMRPSIQDDRALLPESDRLHSGTQTIRFSGYELREAVCHG